MNKCHLCDCMDFMKGLPDNAYDLAIYDPPYGIGMGSGITGKLKTNFGGNSRIVDKSCYASVFDDTAIPSGDYFNELHRVSINSIIWGGNYFIEYLSNTPCFIVWNKDNGKSNQADCEIAYTSFKSTTRMFKYRWHGLLQDNMKNKESRIHPTQKPVALYKWLLQNYAKPGQTIFDSHVGSGSIRIACHDLGFDFEGCEIDKDYWNAQEARYKRHAAQEQLFDQAELTKETYEQVKLIG